MTSFLLGFRIKSQTVSMQITRADGTVEPEIVAYYYHSNPFVMAGWRLMKFAKGVFNGRRRSPNDER